MRGSRLKLCPMISIIFISPMLSLNRGYTKGYLNYEKNYEMHMPPNDEMHMRIPTKVGLLG